MHKQMAYHAIEEGSGCHLAMNDTLVSGRGQNSFGTTRALLNWRKR
jgi:hypothetical protein